MKTIVSNNLTTIYWLLHNLPADGAAMPDLRFPSKPVLEEAMRGHVVAEAQLIGTYIKGQ